MKFAGPTNEPDPISVGCSMSSGADRTEGYIMRGLTKKGVHGKKGSGSFPRVGSGPAAWSDFHGDEKRGQVHFPALDLQKKGSDSFPRVGSGPAEWSEFHGDNEPDPISVPPPERGVRWAAEPIVPRATSYEGRYLGHLSSARPAEARAFVLAVDSIRPRAVTSVPQGARPHSSRR